MANRTRNLIVAGILILFGILLALLTINLNTKTIVIIVVALMFWFCAGIAVEKARNTRNKRDPGHQLDDDKTASDEDEGDQQSEEVESLRAPEEMPA